MDETRNNRKLYFIIALILFIIIALLFGAFVIFRNGKKGTVKENSKLVLKCKTSEMMDEINVAQEISLYELNDNELKMNQRFIIRDSLNRDLSEIKDLFDDTINTNLKNEYGDMQNFYSVNSTNNNNNRIVVDVEYLINDETSDAAASLFSIDLFNSSVAEIKSSFEEAGLKCEE